MKRPSVWPKSAIRIAVLCGCRYYVKAKLGADLPSVRTKIATGAEPVFNELITLECKVRILFVSTLGLEQARRMTNSGYRTHLPRS